MHAYTYAYAYRRRKTEGEEPRKSVRLGASRQVVSKQGKVMGSHSAGHYLGWQRCN